MCVAQELLNDINRIQICLKGLQVLAKNDYIVLPLKLKLNHPNRSDQKSQARKKHVKFSKM